MQLLHSTASLRPLALMLALGFSAAGAQAQSLQELYDAARGYDATYLGARAAADAAVARQDQAKALWLPSVGLSAGVTRSNADTPYSSTRTADQTVKQVGVQAQQNLFNMANSASVDQAKRAAEVAQAALRGAEQDLIVRVSQAYFDVLASRDALATVQANKKFISEQLASAKRSFEVGTATITDTREAQARYDLALAQELAAQNDLSVKSVALEQLVGHSSVDPKPLALPVTLPTVEPADDSAWVREAEAHNTNIEQARLGVEIAKLETSKARAGHLPTLALTGSYGRSHVSVDGDAYSAQTGVVPYSTSGTGTNRAIGLTLNVPLFAGFAVQNRVKETLSLEDKARNDFDAARRAVTQGARTAYLGVQAGQAQVKALEAAEASSQLALEATQLGYKVGVRVNLDVLNAQTQLLQTRRDLAKARYDVIVGGLKLRQAAGSLQPADVTAVNALLAK